MQSNHVVNKWLTLIFELFSENEEEFIFEKKRSKKIVSCAVPLQIIWYNFLSCNPEVHKSILLYEPLHLEVVYTMLREQSGCKFKIEVSTHKHSMK